MNRTSENNLNYSGSGGDHSWSLPIVTATDSGSDVVNAPCSNMCQTELGILDITAMTSRATSRPFFSTMSFIHEMRIVSKLAKSTPTFGCDDETLYEHSEPRSVIPCPELGPAPHTGYTDPNYSANILIPWLRSSLTTLDAYASTFRGPNRDAQMLEWLRIGARSGRCKKLSGLLQRCAEMSGSFVDVVGVIKRSCRWTDQAIAESSLKRVLNWSGSTKDDNSMQSSWEEFLDSYYEVNKEILESRDSELKTLLRRFIRQNATLTACVTSLPRNLTFLGVQPDGTHVLLSPPVETGNDACHIRLICMIQHVLESWTTVFGVENEMRSQSGFGMTEKREKISYGGISKSQTGLNQTNPGGKRGSAKTDFPQKNRGQKVHKGMNSGTRTSDRNDDDVSTTIAGARNRRPGEQGTYNNNYSVQGKNGSSTRPIELKSPHANVKTLKAIPSSPVSSSKLFSMYPTMTHYSLDDKLVTVMFDTGNEAGTIFPSKLLEFCTNAHPTNIEIPCAGKGSNYLNVTHQGSLKFMAPLDDGSTRIVELQGYFMSPEDSHEDEIILGRRDMAAAPGFNAGKQFPLTAKLSAYPDDLFGITESLRQEWTVQTTSPYALRRIRGSNKQWVDRFAITSLAEEIEVDLGPLQELCSAERLIWKLHNRLGHPSNRSLKLTLETYGLQVAETL